MSEKSAVEGAEDGRATDERVAREVLGWTHKPWAILDRVSDRVSHWFRPGASVPDNLPRYSTDRSAALEVVDRLTEAGLRVDLCGDSDGWTAAVLKGHHDLWEDDARSLPLAICRAALHPRVLGHLRASEREQ